MRILHRTGMRAVLSFLAAILAGSAAGGSPPIRNVGEAGLIKVDVRVYDGNRFVDSLGPGDFELLENGIPRNIQSLSFVGVKGKPPAAATGSAEASERAGPKVFLLCFEMDEDPPQMDEAIDYFFENVPDEGDTVILATPRNQWKLTVGPKDIAGRKRLAGEWKPQWTASLRRGGQTVRQRLMALRDMAAFDGDEFMIRWRARETIDQMINEQSLDETRYLAFADYFRQLPGRKDVFIFYREEAFSIPRLFLEDWQNMVAVRQQAFDRKRLRTYFADAGLTFHFLFLRKEKRAKVDIELREDGSAMKGDFFQAFRSLAVLTGGIVATTANPVFAMKLAAAAAGSYYILAFRPSISPPDASFKEIAIKVKEKSYGVIHRAGYIAR